MKAILDNSGTPELATGITAAEVRTLIGAGTSSFDGAYGSLSGRPTIPAAPLLRIILELCSCHWYHCRRGKDCYWCD